MSCNPSRPILNVTQVFSTTYGYPVTRGNIIVWGSMAPQKPENDFFPKNFIALLVLTLYNSLKVELRNHQSPTTVIALLLVSRVVN